MKHHFTLLVVLVLVGLLIAPFAAAADAPIADPPPGAELPPASEPPAPPPAADDGANVYCPLPGIVYEGECTIFLDGDLSASEVATILTIAYAIDPLLGTAPIELPVILRYLKVHTPNIPGIGPITAIQVGATCSAFVAAERLNDAAYYTCYAILSRAAGNATDHLCPALDKLIDLWLGRAGTAASKQMLETALMAKNAFCFGKTVGIGGMKVLAMRVQTELPAEPAPGGETPGAELPAPEPTPEVATEAGHCPYPFFPDENDGDCMFVLTGAYTDAEVQALYYAAIQNNPFLQNEGIEQYLPFIRTYTSAVGDTMIQIGATCRAFADSLGVGYVERAGAYSDCVDAIAKVSGDLKTGACAALRTLIHRLFQLKSAGTITAGQARTLATVIAIEGQLCANV